MKYLSSRQFLYASMEAIKHKAMEYEYSMLKVYQYSYKLFSVIPSKIFLEIYTGKEIEEE